MGVGGIYGCGCKEVYRFPHITYTYILVLGRLIDSSINNRLAVIFSDYRFVRNIIDYFFLLLLLLFF